MLLIPVFTWFIQYHGGYAASLLLNFRSKYFGDRVFVAQVGIKSPLTASPPSLKLKSFSSKKKFCCFDRRDLHSRAFVRWSRTHYKDLKRFFLSPFFHINESHLVYNMLSLLWKGIQLETSMGSAGFASMVANLVATLVAMSQGVTLLLARSLLLFFDYERPFYNECTVGFSSVLFAMKVIVNAQSDDYISVHGLMVPTHYVAWAELILIQMFVPGVSFLGHLGGILAGLMYLRLKASYSGPNPVRQLMGGFSHALNWPLRLVKSLLCIRPRFTGRGTTGSRSARDTLPMWR